MQKASQSALYHRSRQCLGLYHFPGPDCPVPKPFCRIPLDPLSFFIHPRRNDGDDRRQYFLFSYLL